MSDTQGGGGQDGQNQEHPGTPGATAGQGPADPAEAHQQAPSDAPGAADATPGVTEPSGEAQGLRYGCPVDESSGATVIHCNREQYLDLCRGLKADGYAMPIGVTGVDYLTHPGRLLPDGIRPERFEVVTELLNLAEHKRARVRCQVPATDPAVPSVYDLWPGVEAHERETYDMFGVRFDGHPDLTRILMPDDWEGHPLRKDYDTGHIPVRFKEARQ